MFLTFLFNIFWIEIFLKLFCVCLIFEAIFLIFYINEFYFLK